MIYVNMLFTIINIYVIVCLLLFSYTVASERRFSMPIIITFLVSTVASIIAYYICKWLSRYLK